MHPGVRLKEGWGFGLMGLRLHICPHIPCKQKDRVQTIGKRKDFPFALLWFEPCLLVYTVRLREYTSVWQSVSLRADERPGKTNRKKVTDREKENEITHVRLFVSFLSVCSPHSRRSTLVTVTGDGEDRKSEIMCNNCIIVSHNWAQRSL